MKDSVERFLASLAPSCASSTVVSHRYGLGDFCQFCAERGIGSPAEVGKTALSDFGGWLDSRVNKRGGGLSYASKVIELRSARSFLLWAYETGEAWVDFFSFSMEAARSRPCDVPTIEAMKRLLSLPNLSTPVGCRDRLILELLYVLGLRRSECEALDLSCVDLGDAVVNVRGKGGHERRLPLSAGLLRTLRRYLENGRPRLAALGEIALLVRVGDGQRLSHGSLYHVLRQLGKRLGLELRPHQLRHACATHLLEAGMDIRLIAELLGHNCLDSTRRYARVHVQMLHREFRRCHPRALLPKAP